MPITLDRYLYLDKTKTKVVEESDPAAAFTLGGPGSVISDEDAKLYGLAEFLAKGTSASQSPLGKKASTSPLLPPLGKATQPPENKGK